MCFDRMIFVKLIKTICLFLSTLTSIYAQYPYELADNSYKNTGEIIEISPMSPIKDQGAIGLCYAFAAASLLEHYRCSELGLSCSDSKDFLSTLDVASYEESGNKTLKEGGTPQFILTNIANERKVAREECAPYLSLRAKVNLLDKSYENEQLGWQFLSEGWKNLQWKLKSERKTECISCMANNIKCMFPNMKTPLEQIEGALKDAKAVESFLYKTIIPEHCLDKSEALEIPKYVVSSFPTYLDKDLLGLSSLENKIIKLLSAKIPMQVNICTAKADNGRCSAAHAIVLYGLKEVCNEEKNECKKMVKVKNSYGEEWQKVHNDGWVDLQVLAKSSKDYSAGNNIVWLEKPNP